MKAGREDGGGGGGGGGREGGGGGRERYLAEIFKGETGDEEHLGRLEEDIVAPGGDRLEHEEEAREVDEDEDGVRHEDAAASGKLGLVVEEEVDAVFCGSRCAAVEGGVC